VLYPAAGVALGLLLNPYFPENISFIISHILPKVTDPTATSVGNEWYPYQTWTLVGNSGGALVIWILSVFAIGWRGRRFDRPQLTAFTLSIIFGYLLFKSRRFIEYFPPFALIFAALSIGPLLRDPQLGPRVSGWLQTRFGRIFVPVAFAVLVIAMAALTVPKARAAMEESKPADTYADASAWLLANTPPGSMIFQTDWDDFPRLFFYNSANIYTAGLDPTYMELYDADLYNEWVDLTRGKVADPSAPISERFGAAYAISDLAHEGFMQKAADDPHMQEVYRDKFAVIYHIVGR
jgi:asparagine N-glycosylation enzyme membrane subunit Stt3